MAFNWTNPESLGDGGGRLRTVEQFTGLRIRVIEGDGTSESPYRDETHWFDERGKRIASNDPCETGEMA